MTLANKVVLRSKCVVLGNPGSGKSALVQMFHSDGSQYPKTYAMTIHCDVCVKVVNIPDTDVSVELFIHDVGGHDAFQEMWPRYIESATTFVLVYDVTSLDSFKALPKWIHLAQQRIKHISGKTPTTTTNREITGVVVATKTDQTLRRVVSRKQGEEAARGFGLAYMECSAATNTDVDAPFYFLSAAFHEQFEGVVKSLVRFAA
ncbi:P-loop containing nucleoside triphosphate hydrolase protein [Fimicolochytrium jonesii]|uniref:P-loop containing nucleoside triphosphate hydrolase protein n=1 Tax=Fimicolochytrium jonesii TaxID=1396493 RepID=UPI0022FF11B0|nr:P-loop containing nucleoside triphosphate hydrolase protein [Fimicolochytrium jonesii]KAI8820982.1 P-loop containing nucleoside triphosphate hydrolase protein [Fimicolochytrium jonesii]